MFESGTSLSRGMAFRMAAWMTLVLLASGCARTAKPVDPSSRNFPFQGLEEGVTTHKAVVARFGEPAESYEDGQVTVWCLDKEWRPQPGDDRRIRYHLVTVIDEEGVVQRFSLIRVR